MLQVRILDPGPQYDQGCRYLFGSILRARPRLHCFGHNHRGWGATLVEWRDNQLDEARLENDSEPLWIHKRKELLSVQDVRTAATAAGQLQEEQQRLSTVRDLAKTHCVPTSHCAGDEDFIQKGRQTLFVNASWSLSKEEPEDENDDEHPWIQWPWLVDIELPKKSGETKTNPPQKAYRHRPGKKSNEGTSTKKGANNSHCSKSKTKGSRKL